MSSHMRSAFTAPTHRTVLRALRLLLLILAPAVIIAGVVAWRDPMQLSGWFGATPSDLPAPFPSPHRSWADHVAAIDRAVIVHRFRAEREPSDWLSPSAEAANFLDRASMTGRWQDYAAAEAALALAQQRSVPATAPHALTARLALALHNNAGVEPALRAATADLQFAQAQPQAEAATLRGDAALYSGDWRGADRLYQSAWALAPSETIAFRRAFIVERTQSVDAAIAAWLGVAQSAHRPSRRLLSALSLRIAGVELARGSWQAAARWHARANRYLPGDWHVEARLAQDKALSGDLDGAITAMQQLAVRQNLPELWEALAHWQRAAGNVAAADAALARAAAGWLAFAEHYPLASAAHQAEHALIAGDSAAAVAMARSNYANRPYGDAAILLATALIAAGNTGQAQSLLRRVTGSGWRTAESDRLTFELAALVGDGEAAEQARTEAEERNPRAFDQRARLILFGLH